MRTSFIASDANVFNLGGDLDLFCRLIRARNREHLLAYARQCVEGVHELPRRARTATRISIALVQGDALGGGFEAALSCQTIVAEKGVGMGFPEVLFDLFPGMGAYSFLCQRVSPKFAEEMMLNGTIYSSEELHKIGIVDVLVPKGEGIAAVHQVIRRNHRISHARAAMDRVREICRRSACTSSCRSPKRGSTPPCSSATSRCARWSVWSARRKSVRRTSSKRLQRCTRNRIRQSAAV